MSYGETIATINLDRESDESDESDESFLPESDESFRYGEFLPRGAIRPARRPPRPQGTQGGVIQVPGGPPAQVRFNRSLVTQEDLRKVVEQNRADHNETRMLIARLDSQATASVNRVRSSVSNASMMPLLFTLMQPRPALDSIIFVPGQPLPATTDSTPINVQSTTWKSQPDMMLPLLLMMMMGGGDLFGSGGGSRGGGGDMQMMMMMLLMMQFMRP
jgi:hypothetical protein